MSFRMIFKGFRFGMLLQFAVGPICVFAFNTSATYGFISGLSVVAAVTIIDALYIMLSCIGTGAILERKNVRTAVKIFGAGVLFLFGLNMILGSLGINILPHITMPADFKSVGFFVQGLVMTASNPLTIIFWGGVFSSQSAENNYTRKELYLFGLGCVMSTFIFLTVVSILGTIISGFLSERIIQILNAAVGAVIIVFGAKLLMKGSRSNSD